MGMRGKTHLEEKYNSRALGDQWESVLRSLINETNNSYHPLIIVGAPRSGTNMLRDVLVSFEGVALGPVMRSTTSGGMVICERKQTVPIRVGDASSGKLYP